jgi:transposase
MDELKTWMQQQLAERRVEPNSGLGDAIGFLQRHWLPLTRFLTEPGAPLDNNVCERTLKMAILHRKNSLAYKTERGAKVGDLFMSLIQTCRLNRVNPFDYFMALVRHSKEVLAHPEQWLPWNFSATLTATLAPRIDTG